MDSAVARSLSAPSSSVISAKAQLQDSFIAFWKFTVPWTPLQMTVPSEVSYLPSHSKVRE